MLYDVENNTWMRIEADDRVIIGVTSILSAIAGKLVRARLKTRGLSVERNQSLGTLESERFVGPIPSPVSGLVIESNQNIIDRPKTINESPYDQGWVAKLKPLELNGERAHLMNTDSSRMLLAQKIAQFRVRCFKAFPDHEMYEIGTECSAVIVRLNEQLSGMPIGEVIHLVSDDPTAYVEMAAWADRSGQSLVDWRREGKLFHFIVRRAR